MKPSPALNQGDSPTLPSDRPKKPKAEAKWGYHAVKGCCQPIATPGLDHSRCTNPNCGSSGWVSESQTVSTWEELLDRLYPPLKPASPPKPKKPKATFKPKPKPGEQLSLIGEGGAR